MPGAGQVRSAYPGLRPFHTDEAEIFFGREQHTDRLLEILQRERFLAVIGPSGCGKSSLVRAGMLPALAAGWLGTGSSWRIAVLRPGERPLHRLAEALLEPTAFGPELLKVQGATPANQPPEHLPHGGYATRHVEAELRRGPLGLIDLNRAARRLGTGIENVNLLVLVDQFEELFSYAKGEPERADESEAFVELLLNARLDPASRIHVCLTMRTDFLGECMQFIDLPEAINRAQYLTPRLRREELYDTIVGPARIFGDDPEPTLAEELVNAVSGRQDELPLLQHVLSRMWALGRTHPGGPRTSWENYRRAGGVEQALSLHAEALFESLSEQDRVRTEQLFRCAIERRSDAPEGREVRRPQTLGQIEQATGTPWQSFVGILELFAGDGVSFLSAVRLPITASTTVDISHEALIRQWQRLGNWVKNEAERASEYRRWRSRMLEHGKGGEMLAGADLARAIEWRDGVRQVENQAARWTPTAAWARRYANATLTDDVNSEFTAVLDFISASEEGERARAAQEQDRERQRLEALAMAAQAKAEIERARADAANHQKAEAEKHAREYLAQKLLAEQMASLAEERASEALARQIATEALQSFVEDPDKAQLLAALAYETAPLPSTELVLRQACVHGQDLGRVLRGHAGPVTRSFFSPDGRLAVTVSDDRAVRLWEVATGRLVARTGLHDAPVSSACLSPGAQWLLSSAGSNAYLWDVGTGELRMSMTNVSRIVDARFGGDGRTVVAAGVDLDVRVWDVEGGGILRSVFVDRRRPHAGVITAVDVRPDGRQALTASADRTVRLWDLDTTEMLGELTGNQSSVISARYSPDGRLVASAGEDGTAHLWHVDTLEPMATLRGHSMALSCLAFSPTDPLLLTGSQDGTARLWNLADASEAGMLQGHQGAVWAVAWSPDGQMLATAGADDTVRVWEARSMSLLSELHGHDSAISIVAFSADSRFILSASFDGTARVWDAGRGSPCLVLGGHHGAVTYAAFSPDSSSVATGDESGSLRLWATATGTPMAEIAAHGKRISSIRFAGSGRRMVTTSLDGRARLWDALTLRELGVLDHQGFGVLDAAFSPDGHRVLTAGIDSRARLWSTSSGESRGILGGSESFAPGATATDGALSHDGNWVVWRIRDGAAVVADTATCRRLFTLGEHHDALRDVRFSDDGTAVISASDDGTARIWKTADGSCLRVLEGHGGSVTSACFGADGVMAITSGTDHTARVWKPGAPGQRHACSSDHWSAAGSESVTCVVLRGHVDAVSCSALSDDGRLALTGGADGTARLWETGSGLCLRVLRGHRLQVRHAEFGSAANALTASDDGTARIWNIAADRPIAVFAPSAGHADRIETAAFGPTGSSILTAGKGRRAHVRDAETLAVVRELDGHDESVLSGTFASDGAVAVTVSGSGTVRTWELGDGPRPSAMLQDLIPRSIGFATAVAVCPAGQVVLVADDDGSVLLVDALSGRPRRLAPGCHAGGVVAATFGPGGQTFATAGHDKVARLWRHGDGQLLATFAGHQHAVRCVSISQDGRVVGTVGDDRRARLWRADDGTCLHEMRYKEARFLQILFNPDGRTCLTVSGDARLQVWSVSTGELLVTLEAHTDKLTHAAYSPDGTLIASCSWDGTAVLWAAGGDRPIARLEGHEGHVAHLCFDARGGRIATAGADGSIRLWSCPDGRQIARLDGHTARIRRVAFSADGESILSGADDRTVRSWNANTGKLLSSSSGFADSIVDLAIASASGRAVVLCQDGKASLWDPMVDEGAMQVRGVTRMDPVLDARMSRDGGTIVLQKRYGAVLWSAKHGAPAVELMHDPKGSQEPGEILCTAVSADGGRLVTTGQDGTAFIWTVEGRLHRDGVVRKALPPHRKRVHFASFDSAGLRLVTATADEVRVWEAASAEEIAELAGLQSPVSLAVFNAQGTRLATASADCVARIWDARTGRLLATLRGHGNEIRQAQFSPDGLTIVTGSDDHSVRVWDVASGRLLQTWHVGSQVVQVAFSPSGHRLLTIARDGTLAVWDSTVSALPAFIAQVIAARVGRALTDEERNWIGGEAVGAVSVAAT